MGEPSNFSRNGSMRNFLQSSFRASKKFFTRRRTIREHTISEHDQRALARESLRNVLRTNVTEEKVFPPRPDFDSTASCPLVKYFPNDQKSHKVYTLQSFERKRRLHQVFGLDHHANEQLFCPLQASQIEFSFKSSTKDEIIIKIHSPNGESSSYLRPTHTQEVVYQPNKLGCGHGIWTIHVAKRQGCRFKHVSTTEYKLFGQGSMSYSVDEDCKLILVERLWLDCLN